MLRTVSFEIEKGDVFAVTPYVDGTSLVELVEVYERAKGYLDPAGGYGGLVPAYFKYGPLNEYFAGKSKSEYWENLKGIYLLGCSCREVGCWPLIASVSHQGDTVTWTGFQQPFRPKRDYSKFGPFMFSRAQYEGAVNNLMVSLDSMGDGSST